MSSPVVVRDGRADLCDTYSSSREERVVAGAVLNEREGAEAVRGARRVGWGRAVFGSACLWAWGFLAYLSPVLIPGRATGRRRRHRSRFLRLPRCGGGCRCGHRPRFAEALRCGGARRAAGVRLAARAGERAASADGGDRRAMAPRRLRGDMRGCGNAARLRLGRPLLLGVEGCVGSRHGLVPRGLWDLFRNSLALRRNALCRGGPGRCCLSAPSFLGPLVLGCLGTFGACSRGVPLLCSLYRHSGFAGFLGEGSR